MCNTTGAAGRHAASAKTTSTRTKSLSAFRGEREGPVAQRWEGEVGDVVNRLGELSSPFPLPPAGGVAGGGRG
jgi:hypothetical protein